MYQYYTYTNLNSITFKYIISAMSTQNFFKQYIEISNKIERLQKALNFRKETVSKLEPIITQALNKLKNSENIFKSCKTFYEKKTKEKEYNIAQMNNQQVQIDELRKILSKLEGAVNINENVS